MRELLLEEMPEADREQVDNALDDAVHRDVVGDRVVVGLFGERGYVRLVITEGQTALALVILEPEENELKGVCARHRSPPAAPSTAA